MEIRLDGRTAVITGGSKGLGLAMATRFAASGADVAMLARRPEVLEEARAAIAATAKRAHRGGALRRLEGRRHRAGLRGGDGAAGAHRHRGQQRRHVAHGAVRGG